MAEFALKVTPTQTVVKEKYDEIQPVGAVLEGFSDRRIRRKWLEIVCDLWRPSKRQESTANHMAKCGWTAARCQAIADLWSETLWSQWMDTERAGADQDTAKTQLWDGEIASVSGWVAAVGKEPSGVEDAVNTVPWSLDNLKNFFMVVSSGDLTRNEQEAIPGKKMDVVDFREAVMPRHVVDWEGDLGLTANEIDEIRDPSIIVFPRFDRPVVRGKIRAFNPNIPAMRGAVRG